MHCQGCPSGAPACAGGTEREVMRQLDSRALPLSCEALECVQNELNRVKPSALVTLALLDALEPE